MKTEYDEEKTIDWEEYNIGAKTNWPFENATDTMQCINIAPQEQPLIVKQITGRRQWATVYSPLQMQFAARKATQEIEWIAEASKTKNLRMLINMIATSDAISLLEPEKKALNEKYYIAPINVIENKKWKLTKPIEVLIEEQNEQIVASLPEADLFGYADTVSDAIDDLKAIMVNQIEFLEAEKEKYQLGAMPQNQLNILSAILVSKE